MHCFKRRCFSLQEGCEKLAWLPLASHDFLMLIICEVQTPFKKGMNIFEQQL